MRPFLGGFMVASVEFQFFADGGARFFGWAD